MANWVVNLKQKMNFICKLEEDNGTTMFFVILISEETIFEFPQNFVSII